MMRNGESLCMGGWGLAIATIAEPVPAVPVSLGRARAVDHVASVNERVVGVTSRGQRGAALFPRLGAAAEGLTPTFAVGEDAAVCIHLFLRCLVSPVRLPGSPVVGYHRTGFVPYANAILPIRAPLVTGGEIAAVRIAVAPRVRACICGTDGGDGCEDGQRNQREQAFHGRCGEKERMVSPREGGCREIVSITPQL